MKSLRVLITDLCNAKCPNCINRRIRTEKAFIDAHLFEKLCIHFEKAKVCNIKIMGGEPSIHPNFTTIIDVAQKHFFRVTIFSNGLCSELEKFNPREQDSINYNFNFSKQWNASRFLPQKKGRRILEIVVTKQTDSSKIISELERIISLVSITFVVSLSFDCTENIFKHKDFLLSQIMNIKKFCREHDIETIIDHSVPFCFIYGTKFPTTSKGAICNEECAGLIDPNFNMHFCNQHNEEKLPIMEKGEFLPMEIINNFLKRNHYQNQITVLKKICEDCIFFGDRCNGGCFMANPSITKKDVLENTCFPLKQMV